MRQRFLWLFILVFPLLTKAQGIQWTEGLSWEQVKQKAKQENKYIFLDCFTTWCGPCKKMDKEVYTDNTVGSFFNDKFISVKVQIDKTKNDNDYVKSWYREADSIQKWYLEVYPSYLFVSPEGSIVHIGNGYQLPSDLVALAQTATKPGQSYNDKIGEYKILVDEYKKGIKRWDRMPFMIAMAFKSGDENMRKLLSSEYMDYVAALPPKDRYTKENIQLWAETLPGVPGSSTKRFRIFYNDEKIVDKIMKQKGYAAKLVDRTIEVEFLFPFYKTQPGGEIMAPGLARLDRKITYEEADWNKLFKLLREKFNKSCAKRNVLNARIAWYEKHNRANLFVKCSLKKLAGTSTDSLDESTASQLNKVSWNCFLAITDRKILLKMLPWMKKVIDQYPIASFYVDTYANLLYKAGKKEEAIEWEKKALQLDTQGFFTQGYQDAIEQMKKGLPTYVKEGAVWE